MDETSAGEEGRTKKRIEGQEEAPTWNEYVRFAEQMAYGILHLMPEQLEKLTIGELDQLMDGWEERRKIRLHEQFTMVANLMNVHLKRSSQVSVKNLLEQVLPPDDEITVKMKRAKFMKGLSPEQRKKVEKYVTNNS